MNRKLDKRSPKINKDHYHSAGLGSALRLTNMAYIKNPYHLVIIYICQILLAEARHSTIYDKYADQMAVQHRYVIKNTSKSSVLTCGHLCVREKPKKCHGFNFCLEGGRCEVFSIAVHEIGAKTKEKRTGCSIYTRKVSCQIK